MSLRQKRCAVVREGQRWEEDREGGEAGEIGRQREDDGERSAHGKGEED